MKKLFVVTLLLMPCVCTQLASAQNTQGKWALGFHGGVNMWFNDFNTTKVSPGGEVMLRYGLSRFVSLGLTGGYEVFKSQEIPVYVSPVYTYDYLRLEAIPAAFEANQDMLTELQTMGHGVAVGHAPAYAVYPRDPHVAGEGE